MYRRYYSYNDMPQIVQKNDCEKVEKPEKSKSTPVKKSGVAGLAIDDIILGIIILAILLDDGNDNILLLALAAIFLSGNI